MSTLSERCPVLKGITTFTVLHNTGKSLKDALFSKGLRLNVRPVVLFSMKGLKDALFSKGLRPPTGGPFHVIVFSLKDALFSKGLRHDGSLDGWEEPQV